MARPSIGWTAGAWLTICAGLAAVVAYQLVNSFPLAPTVTAAPPSAPLVELAERPEPPRSPGDDAVEAIAARPLFSEDRRPYEPPPELVEPEVVEVESSLPLELAGTFLTATDQAALILVAGRSPEWLRSGQSIEGWKIGTIGEDRVQLLKGEQKRELLLRDDTAGPVRRSPAALTRQPRGDARESRRERDQDDDDVRKLALELDDDADSPSDEDEEEPD